MLEKETSDAMRTVNESTLPSLQPYIYRAQPIPSLQWTKDHMAEVAGRRREDRRRLLISHSRHDVMDVS